MLFDVVLIAGNFSNFNNHLLCKQIYNVLEHVRGNFANVAHYKFYAKIREY